ncbi:MAG: sodium-dependent transporter, partial [Simkaniaceae bacterium]|nr:sodium-dependent transporter [Simkaniaceae bacterium]
AFAFSGGLFPQWKSIYGMNFLRSMDMLVTSWIIPVGGLLMSIFIGWVFKKDEAKEEFLYGGSPRWLFPVWLFFIRYVVPLVIFTIIIEKTGVLNFDRWFS